MVAGLLAAVAAAGIGIYLMLFAPYNLDNKTFPDTGVLLAVTTQLDVDKDGKLSRDEAKAAEELQIEDAREIKGLGARLPNLKTVSIGLEEASQEKTESDSSEIGGEDHVGDLEQSSSKPTGPSVSIDLSDLPGLKNVSIGEGSNVSSLVLPKTESLTSVEVSTDASLPQLDLSGCGKLEDLVLPDETVVSGLEGDLEELWLPMEFESWDEEHVYGNTLKVSRDELGFVTDIYHAVGQGGDSNESVFHDEGGNISGIKNDMAPDDVEGAVYEWNGGVLTRAKGMYADSYTEYTYDGNGNLAEALTNMEDSGFVCDDIRDFTYSDSGKLERIDWQSPVNPHNGSESWEYDGDRVVGYANDTDGGTTGTTFSYNSTFEYEGNRIVSIVAGDYDTEATRTSFENPYKSVGYDYDKQGRIATATCDDLGITAAFSYDANGNLVKVEESDGQSSFTSTMTYRRVFRRKGDGPSPETYMRLMPSYDLATDRSGYGTTLSRCYEYEPGGTSGNPFAGLYSRVY